MRNLKEWPYILFFLQSYYCRKLSPWMAILCCWSRNQAEEQNSRKNLISLSFLEPPLKSGGRRCQRTQIPWWRRRLLGYKGKWRSGFSQRKHRSSHKRTSKLQLQALINGVCQSLSTKWQTWIRYSLAYMMKTKSTILNQIIENICWECDSKFLLLFENMEKYVFSNRMRVCFKNTRPNCNFIKHLTAFSNQEITNQT